MELIRRLEEVRQLQSSDNQVCLAKLLHCALGIFIIIFVISLDLLVNIHVYENLVLKPFFRLNNTCVIYIYVSH